MKHLSAQVFHPIFLEAPVEIDTCLFHSFVEQSATAFQSTGFGSAQQTLELQRMVLVCTRIKKNNTMITMQKVEDPLKHPLPLSSQISGRKNSSFHLAVWEAQKAAATWHSSYYGKHLRLHSFTMLHLFRIAVIVAGHLRLPSIATSRRRLWKRFAAIQLHFLATLDWKCSQISQSFATEAVVDDAKDILLIRGFDAKQECHIPWGGANCWTWLAAGTGKLKTLVHRLWDGRRNRGVNFAQSVCCWAPQVCLLLQSQFLRNGQHYTLHIFICFIHLYTSLYETAANHKFRVRVDTHSGLNFARF